MDHWKKKKKREKKITLPDIYQKCTWKRFVKKMNENQYIKIKDVWWIYRFSFTLPFPLLKPTSTPTHKEPVAEWREQFFFYSKHMCKITSTKRLVPAAGKARDLRTQP